MQLATYVYVDGVRYGPGDHVPDKVAERITNPDAWADEVPVISEPAGTTSTTQVIPERPRGNASRDLWVAHAGNLGVEVTPTMTRDDIIIAVDRQGAGA